MTGSLQCFDLRSQRSLSVRKEKPNSQIIIDTLNVDCIGTSTSFVFLVICMFCLNDIDAVITSPFGALLSIFYQATGNKAGAICLLIFPVVSMAFAAQGEYADSMLLMLSLLIYAGVSNV